MKPYYKNQMSAETFDSVLCGERCPLAQLDNNDVAVSAQQWAFSEPSEHEGSQDPRFPDVGMMAMHLGSLCRFRRLAGLCEQEVPNTVAAPDSVA